MNGTTQTGPGVANAEVALHFNLKKFFRTRKYLLLIATDLGTLLVNQDRINAIETPRTRRWRRLLVNWRWRWRHHQRACLRLPPTINDFALATADCLVEPLPCRFITILARHHNVLERAQIVLVEP